MRRSGKRGMDEDDEARLASPRSTSTTQGTSTESKDPEAQCDALVHTDRVDKETAIRIFKMFTVLQNERVRVEADKTLEIENLKHELAVLRLAQEDREAMTRVEAKLSGMEQRVKKLEDMARQFGDDLQGIEARLLAMPTKRK